MGVSLSLRESFIPKKMDLFFSFYSEMGEEWKGGVKRKEEIVGSGTK